MWGKCGQEGLKTKNCSSAIYKRTYEMTNFQKKVRLDSPIDSNGTNETLRRSPLMGVIKGTLKAVRE